MTNREKKLLKEMKWRYEQLMTELRNECEFETEKLLAEQKKEILEKIKKTPIEKAHTYASENAGRYRTFDAGQERFKEIIIKIIYDHRKTNLRRI
jgi:hypothetical protein